MHIQSLADILSFIVGFGFSAIGITFLVAAYRISRCDWNEYERNRIRTPGLLKALKGELPNYVDGFRDHRVAAGLAVDLSDNTWKEQGRLSDDALSHVLSDVN